jgi:hypothetical protein
MRLLILVVLFVLLPLPALSAPANCKEYVKSQRAGWWVNEQTVCYCGSALANLTVTLPLGLRVEAVCGLRFDTPSGQQMVDLTHEKLSLDSFKNGDYPIGGVYLSGTTQRPIDGTVTIKNGDEGGLWFAANKYDRRGPVFWSQHLTGISLGTKEHYKILRAPTLTSTTPMTTECRQADATINIRNPAVLMGSDDAAGTSGDVEVIHVSKYKPCEKEDYSNPEAKFTQRFAKDQPADVAVLITRMGGCKYWEGDWPYAGEMEKKMIADQLAKLKCTDLQKTEDQLRNKYAGNVQVIEAINGAKAFEY